MTFVDNSNGSSIDLRNRSMATRRSADQLALIVKAAHHEMYSGVFHSQ